MSPMASKNRVVCLLPVRNGEDDLPGYFESVSRFADAVVALDDGSCDGTFEVLSSNPLVSIVLRNRRRPDYKGWNDSDNRNRLLAAASTLCPDWIVWLDADERIDEADSAALLTLINEEARPNFVYCFEIHRMINDLNSYDASGLFVCRLFAYDPSHRFPESRLHFPLAPVGIPPTKWLYTSIRVQHIGGLTTRRRTARFLKYRECDPDREYQPSYDHLLAPPRHVKRWRRRSRSWPLILGHHADLSQRELQNGW